ncbi:hypothetical protein ACTVCO_08945 [Sanguibacter sp. A247]|uniref:hypothetical protein n=1 Tax=unclassified Sanguibacter TaxID=2645534 RepID=UPI003FD8ECFC
MASTTRRGGLMDILITTAALTVMAAGWMVAAARRRAAALGPDPFRALDIQLRLARLTLEIRRIDDDRTMLARAHHLRSALEAYDVLLAEACTLADGAPRETIPLGTTTPADIRLDRELLLSARGWSW